MKKTILSLALTSALASTAFVSTHASAAVEANIGVTSDYLWRGVSQSSDSASVSGGLDYSNDSGFYAGTWIGSLGDADSGFSGSEVDFYLGYGGEIGDFGYDVGYILYHYPSIDDGDFGELYFNGSIADFGFGLAYTTNSDADDDVAFGEGGLYLNASYGVELSEEYSLSITVGHYDFDSANSDDDYSHVQVDISKGDFTFTISKAEESDIAVDDTKFVVSWGTTF